MMLLEKIGTCEACGATKIKVFRAELAGRGLFACAACVLNPSALRELDRATQRALDAGTIFDGVIEKIGGGA